MTTDEINRVEEPDDDIRKVPARLLVMGSTDDRIPVRLNDGRTVVMMRKHHDRQECRSRYEKHVHSIELNTQNWGTFRKEVTV